VAVVVRLIIEARGCGPSPQQERPALWMTGKNTYIVACRQRPRRCHNAGMPLRHTDFRLTRLMAIRDVTGAELARQVTELGVPTTPSYISRLAAGLRSRPGADLIGALSEVLGVPYAYWFDDEQASQFLDSVVSADSG